jgi:hypothetical protein
MVMNGKNISRNHLFSEEVITTRRNYLDGIRILGRCDVRIFYGAIGAIGVGIGKSSTSSGTPLVICYSLLFKNGP